MRRGIGMAVAAGVVVATGCLLEIDRSRIGDDSSEGGALDDRTVLEADGPSGDVDSSPPRDSGVDGLIGFWTFDDAVGTVALDQSGHGHDATLSGSARFDDAGRSGGSVLFTDGGQVAIPDLDGLAFPHSGTISIYVRYTFPIADDEPRGIFDIFQSGRRHLLIRRGADAAPKAFQAGGQFVDGIFAFVHTFEIEPSTWTRLVFTWDEPTRAAVIYADKDRIRQLTLPEGFAPDGQLVRLGVNFIGSIDEVRLYDRALTFGEILALP